MRKLFWSLMIIIGLLAAALATPFLVSLKGYIPELTRLVSERIGEPVSIRNLRLQLLPTPRVAIVGLKLGRRDEVTIKRGSIVPDLLLLLSGEKVIRVVFADEVRVKQSALNLLDRLSKSGGGGEGILVRRIVLRRVVLEHRSLKLPPLNVVLDLALDPTRTVARISSDDGTFRATLVPQGGGRSRLSFKARNWRLPITAASLSFETLEARGVLAGDRLDLPEVSGRLYGGEFAGSFDMRWGRRWQIGGKARLEGVQMVPLQAALGKLSKGGTTKFQTFKGNLSLRGSHIDVTGICVRSPSLTAAGKLAVAPDKTLSGRLDVSVSRTGGFIGAPMALSGTTSDPSLSLTRAGAIGAVIGTMLLPVIGTSLALKASSSLEGRAECN